MPEAPPVQIGVSVWHLTTVVTVVRSPPAGIHGNQSRCRNQVVPLVTARFLGPTLVARWLEQRPDVLALDLDRLPAAEPVRLELPLSYVAMDGVRRERQERCNFSDDYDMDGVSPSNG